jgi:2-polyprenyl-6-methoxyphenol hydroxylase-like FAD-dependent oxidoreductase
MHVIIAGGGLGGLVLAHYLVQAKNLKHTFTVLERDESENSRDQGIVIGLSQQAIDILVELHFENMLKNVLQSDGPSNLHLLDSCGRDLVTVRNIMSVSFAGEKRSCLVNRAQLRKELASALPSGIIQWNSKVETVEYTKTGVSVRLANGKSIEGSILIGADGARSHIRSLFFPKLIPETIKVWTMAGVSPIDLSDSSPLVKMAKSGLVRM